MIARKRIEEFYTILRAENDQLRLRTPFENEIRQGFIRELRTLFNGKCAYCESLVPKGSSETFDHFRPRHSARGLKKEFAKDHYWWLIYEWGNLYYVCQTCNRFKSSWFPVEKERAAFGTQPRKLRAEEKALLIDPCHDRPEHHLLFRRNGEVEPVSFKGRVTIDILKLNRNELIQARAATLDKLEDDWKEYKIIRQEMDIDHPGFEDMNVDVDTILNGTSDKPYLAAQRQLLREFLKKDPKRRSTVYSGPTLAEFTPLKDQELTDQIRSLRHVYLEKLELKNFKCFSFLEITFPGDNDGSPTGEDSAFSEPWLLFLGENSVGKSSILKAIAIALMGEQYSRELNEPLLPKNLLKYGTDSGYIKLYLKGEKEPIEIHLTDRDMISAGMQQEPIANLVGYGSVRLLPKKTIQPEKGDFMGVRAANLFDYSVALTDGSRWLLELDEEGFGRAALVLKDLLLLKDTDRISRDLPGGSVTVISGDESPVTVEELSDGYKAVFGLAVDIMATLAGEKVSYDLAEGIVLIDEIGTHLHPRWKMQVVAALRRCFPRVQFIVTTHEPLCLRGLRKGEIVVLQNTGGGISALTDLPDPAGLRVDQLLTSELFGLNSVIDSRTEELFEKYYTLLAIDKSDRTPEQQRRLEELRQEVPRMRRLGDDTREDLIYDVVDELLAKKSRESGLKIHEKLSHEAISRVQRLWQDLSSEKPGNA